MHLNLDLAVALALPRSVRRSPLKEKQSRRVATRLRLRRARKQRAQIIPQANIGRRVRTRRATDRRLVNVDHLIDALDALNLLVRTHGTRRTVDGIRKRGRNRIGDQGALARSRNTGNDCERTELNLGGNVFEVVGAGAVILRQPRPGLRRSSGTRIIRLPVK